MAEYKTVDLAVRVRFPPTAPSFNRLKKGRARDCEGEIRVLLLFAEQIAYSLLLEPEQGAPLTLTFQKLAFNRIIYKPKQTEEC